jgi:hypothetical protein
MSTAEARTSTKSKRAARPLDNGRKSKSHQESQQSAAPTEETGVATSTKPPTKHDRILSLLGRRKGATIPEMMQATNWQQHSVRGFLAGTVKKKLGLALVTSKAVGEVRRYRIETRRGR